MPGTIGDALSDPRTLMRGTRRVDTCMMTIVRREAAGLGGASLEWLPAPPIPAGSRVAGPLGAPSIVAVLGAVRHLVPRHGRNDRSAGYAGVGSRSGLRHHCFVGLNAQIVMCAVQIKGSFDLPPQPPLSQLQSSILAGSLMGYVVAFLAILLGQYVLALVVGVPAIISLIAVTRGRRRLGRRLLEDAVRQRRLES
jgi:hypothetical protein